VHRMMADGLLDEVERLRARWQLSRTAAQALGYKELIGHLDGQVSLDHAVEQVIVRTRQFAVRQDRWFRRDPRVQWVDIEADPVTETVPVIEELLMR
jgi:tRNA dimethylallyltransferase